MTTGEKRSRSRSSGSKVGETPKAASDRTAPKHPAASRRRIIFVLGMHRSGTSMATRVFNLAGAALPRNIMPAGLGNPLGHWEPAQAAALNDEILSSVGLIWDSLANLPAGWFETEEAAAFAERAAALLADELPKGMLAVFKDPRICRLAPLWIRAAEMAGWEASAVLVLRNPVEIAASLRVRNAFPPAVSHMLALKHTLEAERYSRNLPRSIVTYDRFLSDWRGTLDRIGKDLDLRWPRLSFKTMVEIDDFVSDSQRHHRTPAQGAETGSSAGWGGTVFQLLAEASDGKPLDVAALDQISDRLNSADSVFGPLLAIAESATESASKQAAERAGELAQLRGQLDGQTQTLAQEQLRTVALQGEVDHFAVKLAAAEAERDAARQEAAALGGRAAETEAALADAHRKADAAATSLAASEAERAAARREAAELGARLAASETERDVARRETAEFGVRLAAAEAERDTARRETVELGALLTAAEAERDAARRETAELGARLAVAETERDASRQEAAALGGRAAETEAALADLHRKADAAAAQFGDRLAAAEAERDAARREAVALGGRAAETEAALADARRKADAATAGLAAAEAERAAARREAVALADAHRETAERIAELEEQVGALSQMVRERDTTLQARTDALESLSDQNTLQNERLSEHLARFAQVDKTLAEQSAQIAQIESEKATLTQDINRLRQSLAGSEREREGLTAKAQALAEERDALAGRAADLESAQARTETEANILRAAVVELKAENTALKESIAQHVTRLAQIEDGFSLLHGQVRHLEHEKAEMTRVIEAIQADVKARDRQMANLVTQGLMRGVNIHPEGFDEEFYLIHNKDVLGAIQSGELTDAFEHWVLWGVWEDRAVHFRPVQQPTGINPGLFRMPNTSMGEKVF